MSFHSRVSLANAFRHRSTMAKISLTSFHAPSSAVDYKCKVDDQLTKNDWTLFHEIGMFESVNLRCKSRAREKCSDRQFGFFISRTLIQKLLENKSIKPLLISFHKSDEFTACASDCFNWFLLRNIVNPLHKLHVFFMPLVKTARMLNAPT